MAHYWRLTVSLSNHKAMVAGAGRVARDFSSDDSRSYSRVGAGAVRVRWSDRPLFPYAP
jgi:hypothetical protein